MRISPLLSNLDDLFWEPVQATSGPITTDQVIVAQPVEIAAADVGRVHHDVHILGDWDRLVVADQWALDQIVALAVAIKARFGRPPILPHEVIEGVPDVLARGARLEQIEGDAARLLAKL